MASAVFTERSPERKVLEDFLNLDEWHDKRTKLRREFRSLLSRPRFRAEAFDAWNGSAPTSFTDAFCLTDLSYCNPSFDIGSLFLSGVKVLGNYITRDKLPENDEEVEVLHCLIQYMMDSENQRVIQLFDPKIGETAYCSVLANHLLSKLGVSISYLIDKFSQYKPERCPCTCGTDIEDKFGDTSIGNEDVLHGRLDAVLEDTGAVCMADPEATQIPDLEEPDPSAFVEVKSKHETLDKLLQRFVAQTVVFAFYQHRKNPHYKNSLIPSIGFNKHQVLIYLYDPVRDFFLQSKPFSLLEEEVGMDPPVSVQAIVNLWMVVNYKVLSTGFSAWEDSEIEFVPRANFHDLAQDTIDIYRNHLKFGNVVSSANKRPAGSDWTRSGPLFQTKRSKVVSDQFS